MLDWKPYTNPPPDRFATVLVAYGPELGVDQGFIGRVYDVLFGTIRCAQTGMEPRPPYWWCYEHEVLAGIPGEK
ncbi:MAG: hypothetical protein HYU74_12505 [Dechloromonas sp.]|nr:hypothetical protein [Dechloromonas sp.]